MLLTWYLQVVKIVCYKDNSAQSLGKASNINFGNFRLSLILSYCLTATDLPQSPKSWPTLKNKPTPLS